MKPLLKRKLRKKQKKLFRHYLKQLCDRAASIGLYIWQDAPNRKHYNCWHMSSHGGHFVPMKNGEFYILDGLQGDEVGFPNGSFRKVEEYVNRLYNLRAFL